MNKIIELFREWLSRRAEHRAENRRLDLESRYGVREKNGSLYLTCNGYAFLKINESASASEIIKLLQDARLSSEEYERKVRPAFAPNMASVS